MIGSLAYRGWYTAPEQKLLPLPDMQKRMAARKCNGCATTYSRYWRSDLEQKNGWLCNNCGMNQRRGRGVARIGSSSALQNHLDTEEFLPDEYSPAAESHCNDPDTSLKHSHSTSTLVEIEIDQPTLEHDTIIIFVEID